MDKEKEKEIQEISGIIGEWANKPVFKNPFVMTDVSNSLLADDLAITLYNRGYRKADEVRKKTAKEILQDFYDQTFEMKDPYDDSDEAKGVIDRAEILHTAKMYGVEVDE